MKYNTTFRAKSEGNQETCIWKDFPVSETLWPARAMPHARGGRAACVAGVFGCWYGTNMTARGCGLVGGSRDVNGKYPKFLENS